MRPLIEPDGFHRAPKVTGYPTGYAQLIARPLGWADGYTANLIPVHKASVRNYPPSFEEGRWNEAVPTVNTSQMAEISELYLKLRDGFAEKRWNSKGEKRISVAIRRLNLSSMRTNIEDSVLDAMIGLEALLSDGNQEMTHKVAMRMAGLYKISALTKSLLALQEMKHLYQIRSTIVHGGTVDKDQTLRRDGQKIGVADAAIEHLRMALKIDFAAQNAERCPTGFAAGSLLKLIETGCSRSYKFIYSRHSAARRFTSIGRRSV